MSIFNNPILVTLSDSEPFLQLQTYDEKHGQSQRFYLTKGALQGQFDDGAEGSFVETDLLNYCTITRIGNNIRFNVCWLHGNYDDDVAGYRQTFFIPVDKVAKALNGERVKHLSYQPVYQEKADIFFTQTAHAAIAATRVDKLKLHAIRRFFRDNFSFGNDEHLVVQKDEWVNGFYFFSTISKYEGGIALHCSEIQGKDGKLYQKLFYGLHT